MKPYNQITAEIIQEDMRYLELLSHSFPTIAAASTEIINLEAILNLPKGTEHFLADLHGEYEAFQHVLRNASGAIKRKVNEIFGNTLREAEKKRALHPHLLSRTKAATGEGNGKRIGRLVCHHPEPAGKGMPERFVEIHPVESAESAARGVFIHYPRTPARKQHGS